jgi:hypothetical protein
VRYSTNKQTHDHGAQIVILNVLQNKPHEHQSYFRRNINKCTMAEFKNGPSYFEGYYVNIIFNSFLNTYLRIFYSSFPLIKINMVMRNNSSITVSIKTYCK